MIALVGPPSIIPSGTVMIFNLLLAIIAGGIIYRDGKQRRVNAAILWGLGVGVASIALSFVGTLLAVVAYYVRVIDV